MTITRADSEIARDTGMQFRVKRKNVMDSICSDYIRGRSAALDRNKSEFGSHGIFLVSRSDRQELSVRASYHSNQV